MTASLQNVNLFVTDVRGAVKFYTEALGLTENKERSAPPRFALLETGGCTLTLQDATAPGAVFGKGESIELGFAVDDVNATYERLKAFGIKVSEIQQMEWGGGFDAIDPDGYRLTIYRMRENG